MEDDDMQLLSNDIYLQNGYRELMESGRDLNEVFNLERSQDELLNDIGKGESKWL